MTFRIFNDEARAQISAHIIGAPPNTHPRAGSVSGTDAPVTSYEPTQYDPGGTHTYQSSGGGPPGSQGEGGSICPPVPGLRATAVPVDNSGKCPPTAGGLQWTLSPNGTHCCPSKITPGSEPPGGVRPPSGLLPPITCPSGTKNRMPPAVFQTDPNFNKNKGLCEGGGGNWTQSPDDNSFYFCCVPETQSTPPSATGPGTGTVEDKKYPTTPPTNQIVFHGRPIADIAANQYGWIQVDITLRDIRRAGTPDPGCAGVTSNRGSFTASSTVGLSSSCDDQFYDKVWALNPGGTTIPKGTNIVAVRDFQGGSSSYISATIVVVPCP